MEGLKYDNINANSDFQRLRSRFVKKVHMNAELIQDTITLRHGCGKVDICCFNDDIRISNGDECIFYLHSQDKDSTKHGCLQVPHDQLRLVQHSLRVN